MKISKWVDMGQEVEIEIGVDDIRAALAEEFGKLNEDRLGEAGPNRAEVAWVVNDLGAFFRALTDEQILLLSPEQRQMVSRFLGEQQQRFARLPEV